MFRSGQGSKEEKSAVVRCDKLRTGAGAGAGVVSAR